MRYTSTDHGRIMAALQRVHEAIDAAWAAVAARDADAAVASIEQARSAKREALKSFPAVVMNGSTSLNFEDVYADFYVVDILIIVALQWPDTAPTPITELKELLDAFAEKLADLRRLRAEPWSGGPEEALVGLDNLIVKTEELCAALDVLPPRASLDPREFPWLGQEFKAPFLNGYSDNGQLGTMYGFLFSLDHAIDRSHWSVTHGKMPGASRRLVEAKRVVQLLLGWLAEHQPAG